MLLFLIILLHKNLIKSLLEYLFIMVLNIFILINLFIYHLTSLSLHIIYLFLTIFIIFYLYTTHFLYFQEISHNNHSI